MKTARRFFSALNCLVVTEELLALAPFAAAIAAGAAAIVTRTAASNASDCFHEIATYRRVRPRSPAGFGLWPDIRSAAWWKVWDWEPLS